MCAFSRRAASHRRVAWRLQATAFVRKRTHTRGRIAARGSGLRGRLASASAPMDRRARGSPTVATRARARCGRMRQFGVPASNRRALAPAKPLRREVLKRFAGGPAKNTARFGRQSLNEVIDLPILDRPAPRGCRRVVWLRPERSLPWQVAAIWHEVCDSVHPFVTSETNGRSSRLPVTSNCESASRQNPVRFKRIRGVEN